MTNDEILELDGEFSWDFGEEFFIETQDGAWIWSDPEYGGDNTLRRFAGNHKQWCRQRGIPYSRSKGHHRIKDYCGPDVKVVGVE